MTKTIFMLLSLGFAFAGVVLMRDAASRAIRLRSNVWRTAAPEAGAAVIFMLLALLFAAVVGDWL